MLKVTRARIIKDGKPVMTFNVNDTVEAGGLERYRQEVKNRYADAVMADVQVDLQYTKLQ